MYKLVVIAGPNRGSTYPLHDGTTSLGRQDGNQVVLSSSKISKRHCTLVVDNGQVSVKDQGSSNGTFVNGVLIKDRRIKAGDRLSVGEFVLELVEPSDQLLPAPRASMGNVIPMHIPRAPTPGGAVGSGLGLEALGQSGALPTNEPPKDLKGKAIWWFETRLMPFFYGLLLKQEWRIVCASIFGVFALFNVVAAIYPLLESSRTAIVRELGARAKFMAAEIVERNAPALAARAETKTEIGSIETAENVRIAVLTDLDSRILAPAGKMNQYLTGSGEAILAVKARDAFRAGRESGLVREVGDNSVVAIEPVKVYSPQAGKNVVVAMAIVSLDTSIATPDWGEMGMAYSESIIFAIIVGGLLMMVMYRLTLKPFQVLNEDMDKVLKGELAQVTREFQWEELDSLWDIINSALKRLPRAGEAAGSAVGGNAEVDLGEQVVGPLRVLGALAKFGVAVCDDQKRILHLNPMFEEISGIRGEGAVGQAFADVARDQSLGIFMSDLMDRALAGGESSQGAEEDYDFSGIGYRVSASAFGTSASGARAYLLVFTRAEG